MVMTKLHSWILCRDSSSGHLVDPMTNTLLKRYLSATRALSLSKWLGLSFVWCAVIFSSENLKPRL